jgi:addiction module HigA family antidote
VHPGELLREEFLEPMGITAYQLAKDIGVPAPRVYDIVAEKRGISPDTALRLSRYFGMSEGYWINAQAHYEKRSPRIEAGRRSRGRSGLARRRRKRGRCQARAPYSRKGPRPGVPVVVEGVIKGRFDHASDSWK